MTTLSSLHPYPAMIADDLAEILARRYISRHDFVVDPFCGTGRTLFAAAEIGAECLGLDVNPLAVLLVEAIAAGLLVPQMAAVGLGFTAHTDFEIETDETSGVPGLHSAHGLLESLSDFHRLGIAGVGGKQESAGEQSASNFSEAHSSIIAIRPLQRSM